MTDKTSTYISPEFRETMANFAKGMSEQGDHVRYVKSRIESLTQAILWLEAKLNKLETDPSRKQHNAHKADLKLQIRRSEVELACFKDDWKNIPDVVKNFYKV